MGFMDTIMDVMRLNDDDDEFDNEEYDDFDVDEEEEERPFFRRKSKEKEEPQTNTVRRETSPEPVRVSDDRQVKQQTKITPMRRSSGKKDEKMEVCVIKPTSLDDEREITDTLLNGRAVVINMEGLNVDIAQRIIDFTSGSTYAMQGTMQKISNFIFIATPRNVDVSGDLQNLMENVDVSGYSF